ncbi:PKD domain-containing protein [Candidatus Woesearchaeota archaeon]|nr:PKD domain-containing protein [Candidatus Woesearchaeota archaeon]
MGYLKIGAVFTIYLLLFSTVISAAGIPESVPGSKQKYSEKSTKNIGRSLDLNSIPDLFPEKGKPEQSPAKQERNKLNKLPEKHLPKKVPPSSASEQQKKPYQQPASLLHDGREWDGKEHNITMVKPTAGIKRDCKDPFSTILCSPQTRKDIPPDVLARLLQAQRLQRDNITGITTSTTNSTITDTVNATSQENVMNGANVTNNATPVNTTNGTTANNPPIASFTFTPSSNITANTTRISFSDTSTDTDGQILSWNWNFGSTASSTSQNATVLFAAPGTYNVTLTVMDSDGSVSAASALVIINPGISDTPINTSNVTENVTSTNQTNTTNDQLNQSNTSWQNSAPCNPRISVGNIPVYEGTNRSLRWPYPTINGTLESWCHVDGALIAQNATVCMYTVQNAPHKANITYFGCTLDMEYGYELNVISMDYPPLPNFSYSPENGIIANTTIVQFTDLSIPISPFDTITNRTWYFTDTTTGRVNMNHERNPQIIFTQPHQYTVRLYVREDDLSTGGITKNITVLSLGTQENDTNNSDVTNSTTNTTNTSNMTDGTTANTTQVNTTNGTTANNPPIASFTFTPSSNITANTTPISFSDTSTDSDGQILSWNWNFGSTASSTSQNATVLFAAPGTYNVTLTVTDSDGSAAAASRLVTVNPAPPTYTLESCTPTATDSGTASKQEGTSASGNISINTLAEGFRSGLWINGNLTQRNTTSYNLSVGNGPSTMNVSLLACNATGGWLLQRTYAITDQGPTANFSSTPTGDITANMTIVSFFDRSTTPLDTITNWTWSFGDRSTSTQRNASHTFLMQGTYNVTLTVRDSDGSSSGAGALFVVLQKEMPANTSSISNATLLYDANGNLLEDQFYRYEYDSFNQLARIKNKLSNAVLEQYWYDHDGNRIKKVSFSDGKNITEHYMGNLVRVDNGTGIHDEIEVHHDGQLIGMYVGDEKRFFHPDHLGSTDVVTNSAGELVQKTIYAPYGAVIDGGDSRLLYTGKEQDDTGLVYYGARYYQPQHGRFTQPDWVIADPYDPQNLNKYAYARDNPYKYVDPSGNTAWDVLDIGLAGFDITAFFNNPSWENAGWATLSLISLLPILPNIAGYIRYGDKVIEAGRAVHAVDEAGGLAKMTNRVGNSVQLSKNAKLLMTGEHGTTVTVKSFGEAEKLVHEAFPGYKKVAGNSPILRNQGRENALREAFKERGTGTYKMDFQFNSEGKIHSTAGAHADLPHINIRRLDGNKVTIVIDKAKGLK